MLDLGPVANSFESLGLAVLPGSPTPGAGDTNEIFLSGNTTGVRLPDSSSIFTTPGTSFRRRRGRGSEEPGVFQGEGQLLSLREQERILDKVKKENFGLKMKLVLLEDRLMRQEPENLRRAIKENIEIKVESENLKVELEGYKKSLNQSEKHNLELRKNLEEIESQNGRRGEELKQQTQLQTEKPQVAEECNLCKRLEARCSKLEEEKRQLEDEKNTQDFERRKLEAENQKLNGERNGLEDDLENLRDEMQNKSFSYNSRVTELDDARKLIQQELTAVKQEYSELQDLHKENVLECRNLKQRLRLNGESDGEAQALLQCEKDINTKAHKELEQELHNTTTEEDLLQHRHDALTSESLNLQRDISKLETDIMELNAVLQQEREAAVVESNRWTKALERGNATLEAMMQQSEKALGDWNLEKRKLEARAEKTEDISRSLRNTIEEAEYLRKTLEQKLNTLGEELRQSTESEKALKDNVWQLNDEIEVLIGELEEAEEKIQRLETELADSLTNATKKQVKLEKQIRELQTQLKTAIESREREASTAKYDNGFDLELATVRDRMTETLKNERKDLHEQIEKYRMQIKTLEREANSQKITYDYEKQLLEKDLAEERQELHQHLKQATLEIKQLQSKVETGNEKIRGLAPQLQGAKPENDRVDNELGEAGEEALSMQQAWFAVRTMIEQKIMEAIGMALVIRYLGAKVEREEGFSNQANLQMIERMGIYPGQTIRKKRHTLRAVAQMVIVTIRMRRRKEAWEVNKEMQTKLAKTLERRRRI